MGQKNRFDFDSGLARLFPFLFYLFLQAIPLRLASCTLGGIFFRILWLLFFSSCDLNSGVAFFLLLRVYFFYLHFVCMSILRK